MGKANVGQAKANLRLGPKAAIRRAFTSVPVFFLPAAVILYRSFSGATVGFWIVFLAIPLGVAIAVTLRNPVISGLTTLFATFLLLSGVYMQELMEEERLLAMVHDDSRSNPVAQHEEAAAQPDLERQMATEADGTVVHYNKTFEDSLASPNMETLSVVLPCAFEGEYAVKTVEAIRQNTKRHRLKEIIVVDDGSKPPLQPLFDAKSGSLRGANGDQAPMRLIRHETTKGLIGAKKSGGDAAVGDVVVFFDCHVKPRIGWEEAFLTQMKRAGDHRTLVVPTITSLDPDTWEERGGGGSKAMIVLWNGDFTWLSYSGRDVPLMSGGLLAISRRFWQETGGYDPNMVAWGGENIDQSLRAWLCGGRIEVASGAYVAHMWRDPNKPKTRLKYPMPTEMVMRNKARAVSAWMGEFKDKTLAFPEYDQFTKEHHDIGDMSNFEEIRNRMQCKPFSYYVQRFSYVYLDTGLTPKEVFQLKEETTGWCLQRAPNTKPPHDMVLSPCVDASSQENHGEHSGGVIELQLWHGMNRKPAGGWRGGDRDCCSGLGNWNFLSCISSGGMGHRVISTACETQGHNAGQHFRHKEGRDGWGPIEWKDASGCLGPGKIHEEGGHQEAPNLHEKCHLEVVDGSSEGTVHLKSGGKCVGFSKRGSTYVLKAEECSDADASQTFVKKAYHGGVQIQLAGEEACLDAAAGHNPLAFACAQEKNDNQLWHVVDGRLTWDGSGSFCVDLGSNDHLSFMDFIPASKNVVLKPCLDKVGQRFKRDHIKPEEGGTESFLLKDVDSGLCLRSGKGSQVIVGECSENHRWKDLADKHQVQHMGSRHCLDSNDENKPILYPCHQWASRKQKFHVRDIPTMGIQLTAGYEDNGRRRNFEKCLDYQPEKLLEVNLLKCGEAAHKNIRWTKLSKFVSPEWEMWEKAVKPPPGYIGLGGGAEPP